MLDIDKWPPILQWLVGIGVFFGGLLATWFGAKTARTGPADDTHDELERARDENRDQALRQFITLAIGEAKEAMSLALSATRQSFYTEFREVTRAYEQECGELEQRIRVLENDNAVQKAEITELQRRRNSPR